MTIAKELFGPLRDMPAHSRQQALDDSLPYVVQGLQEGLYVSHSLPGGYYLGR